MACDAWRDKLDAYLDGELAPADARELSVHTRGCAACAADRYADMPLDAGDVARSSPLLVSLAKRPPT